MGISPLRHARRKLDCKMSLLALVSVLALVCLGGLALALPAAHVGDQGFTAGDGNVHTLAVADSPVPIANATSSQSTVYKGTTVTLNATLSQPSTGATIVNYTWKLNPPAQANFPAAFKYGSVVTFLANTSGLYTAVLTVRDSNNLTDTVSINIVVKEKPKTFLEKYWLYLIIGVALGAYSLSLIMKAVRNIRRGLPMIPMSTREKAKLSIKKALEINHRLLKNPMGLIGAALLTFFVLMAIFGPMFAPYNVKNIDPFHKFEKPSNAHWLGTDQDGVDIFSELLVGAQTSIIVGIVSAIIASFLGAGVGLYSGYVGGWKDEVVMRLNDIVLSIPWLVLMIVVAALLGRINLMGIILIIGLTGWSTTARMVRAQVLSIKERQFIERAKCIGASDIAIIRRHVFPNTFPLVFANTILTVAVSILSEATLSYLRLRPADAVTWGKMLSYASESSALKIGLSGWILVPGICIVLLVLSFTLLGYALDEILNPKLRQR
jgi:peptide/nickel transport system permease protein